MAASQSVKYASLVQCTEKLARGISQDPLVIANKLLEVGLVPPKLVRNMLLSSKTDYEKATELVMQLIKVIEGFSEKFDIFIKILKEFYWLNDVVEEVCKRYQINKDEVRQT